MTNPGVGRRSPLDLRVYLVLDPDLCGGLAGMLRVTREALAGGATAVQLRAPGWKKRAWLDAAIALQPICREAGALFVVNDEVDVALAVGADGVHVGQEDLPVATVRRLVGPSMYLGLSIAHEADLCDADLQIADYLGVGPVFPTGTKPDAAPPMFADGLRGVLGRTSLPVVAIGGIGVHNAAEVFAAGAHGVAVVSAVCGAPDPRAVVRELRTLEAARA